MIDMRLGDCMDLMRGLPDKAFDLAIVDPPYGINAPEMSMGTNPKRSRSGDGVSSADRLRKGRLNSGGGKLKNRALNTMACGWDVEPPPPEYFAELFRVSRHQIIWGGNYFQLPPTRGIIAWDKVQPWDNFSQFELAWSNFDRPAGLFRLGATGGDNLDKKIHPTQKPIALYKWLLTKYAKPGNKILDTHGGSGSIAIACHDLGFDLTWIEKDGDYYKAACERYKKHASQAFLFEPEPVRLPEQKELL